MNMMKIIVIWKKKNLKDCLKNKEALSEEKQSKEYYKDLYNKEKI